MEMTTFMNDSQNELEMFSRNKHQKVTKALKNFIFTRKEIYHMVSKFKRKCF